jgi:hypothetical protein
MRVSFGLTAASTRRHGVPGAKNPEPLALLRAGGPDISCDNRSAAARAVCLAPAD